MQSIPSRGDHRVVLVIAGGLSDQCGLGFVGAVVDRHPVATVGRSRCLPALTRANGMMAELPSQCSESTGRAYSAATRFEKRSGAIPRGNMLRF